MTPSEIRSARLALGLTQKQFGELLHAALRTVQDWEAGKRNMTAGTSELLALKIKGVKMSKITYNGQEYDFDAARMLMDDDLCDEIHGTVDTEQEFFDAYIKAHEEKFGEEFVIN